MDVSTQQKQSEVVARQPGLKRAVKGFRYHMLLPKCIWILERQHFALMVLAHFDC